MHSPLVALADHELFKELWGVVQPVTKRIISEVRKDRSREAEIRRDIFSSLNQTQRFAIDLSEALRAIYRAFDTMQKSARLMVIFPTQLKRGPYGISRDEWVDYHFSQFTVATTSLSDLAIALVAEVHQLGLAHRHRTLDIVTGHSAVGSPFAKALRALANALESHRLRRHALVHRGTIPDIGEAAGIDHMELLRNLGFIERVSPEDEDLRLELPIFWRYSLQKLKPALDKMLKDTEKPVSRVLDLVLTEWRRRRDALAAIDDLISPSAKPGTA